jgi:hypothetical protein
MIVESALELLTHGFKVVPVHTVKNGQCSCKNPKCSSIAKHPLPSAWQKVCSSDPLAIKSWWKTFGDINAGVVTGKASGVVVLDIDPRHGGMDTLDDLQAKHGRLPDTATVETGSGGFHYYFKAPDISLKNGANVGGQGVDFRGDNGFVVSPHSLHKSGGIYDWYDGQTPSEAGFSDLPSWLFDLVYKPPVKQVEIQKEGAKVSEGGRNVWLASLAGAIRNKGCGYKTILAALVEANIECCHPPLAPEEIIIIAKSISKYQINGMNIL